MGIFKSTIGLRGDTWRALLTWKTNSSQVRPAVVILQETTRIPRLPHAFPYFSFQWVPAPTTLTGSDDDTFRFVSQRGKDLIKVVAGPSVGVKLVNFPTHTRQNGNAPELVVVRVQDPALVPKMGTHIDLSRYEFDETYDEFGNSISSMLAERPGFYSVPSPRLTVKNRINTVAITNHDLNEELFIDFPVLSHGAAASGDDRCRYAIRYFLEGDHEFRFLVNIVKTPNVNVFWRTGGPRRPIRYAVSQAWFKVSETTQLFAIPDLGEAWTNNGWRESGAAFDTRELELMRAGFDVAVGTLPVIGDLVDIGEFLYAYATGRDRWGRKVNAWELAVLGLAAALPFLLSGTLRGALRGLRATRRAHVAERVKEGLEGANIDDTEDIVNFIRTLTQKIGRRQALTTAEAARIEIILKSLDSRNFFVLDDLLNANKSGFLHPKLQERFKEFKRANPDADPSQWARRQTRGQYRAILERWLGPSYRRSGSQGNLNSRVPIELDNVPRPEAYDEAKRLTDRESLRRYEQQLRAAYSFSPEQAERLARRLINPGNFNRVKGTVGEILAIPKAVEILAEVRRRHPDAKLIWGSKLKTPGGNDGEGIDFVIGIETGRTFEVHAAIEVKATLRGGQDAVAQFFDQVERRLDDGFEFVISDSAHYIDEAGNLSPVGRARRFLYEPESPRHRLRQFTTTERYMIVADGTSHLGLGSSMATVGGVVPEANRRDIGRTVAEIDYLLSHILLEHF